MTENDKKLDLVQWIVELDDEKLIFDLMQLKEKAKSKAYAELSVYEIEGIRKGLNDIENNQIVPHDVVMEKIQAWK
jgi:predicted transcriptional regulator